MFSKFQHLMSHMQPIERPHVCPKCDAGFTHSSQLDAHMKLH